MQKSVVPLVQYRFWLALLVSILVMMALVQFIYVKPSFGFLSSQNIVKSQFTNAAFACQGLPCFRQKLASDLQMPVWLHSSSLNSFVSNTGSSTVWFLVFHNPDACMGSCDEEDLLLADTLPSVVYAQAKLQDLSVAESATWYLSTDVSAEVLTSLFGYSIELDSLLPTPELHFVMPDLSLSSKEIHLTSVAISDQACSLSIDKQEASNFSSCLELTMTAN